MLRFCQGVKVLGIYDNETRRDLCQERYKIVDQAHVWLVNYYLLKSIVEIFI
jgi:hypothetical protein